MNIETKAGLVGYLQGSIKGTVSILEHSVGTGDVTKAELEYYLKSALKQLQKVLVESEKIWEEVKSR